VICEEKREREGKRKGRGEGKERTGYDRFGEGGRVRRISVFVSRVVRLREGGIGGGGCFRREGPLSPPVAGEGGKVHSPVFGREKLSQREKLPRLGTKVGGKKREEV